MSGDSSKPDRTQELRNQPNEQADYATDRSPDQNRVSENRPANPPAWSRTLLWIFSIIISIIVILIDAAVNVFGTLTPDPMPTWLHFFILLLVPVALIRGDNFIGRSFQHPNRRRVKRVLFANGYAIAVSTIYFAIFLFELYLFELYLFGLCLEFIPAGVFMFLVYTVLPLTPVWCTIGSLLQLKWLYARINFHGLSVRKAVYYSCFGAIFAVVIVLLAYGYSHIRAGWEEKVKPSMFSTVRIYNIGAFYSRNLDSESLAKIPSVLWNEESTHEIFNSVQYHPRSYVLWKIPFLAVAKLKDGKEKRLVMARYAWSFAIVGQRGHYTITGVSQDARVKKMEEVFQSWASERKIPQAE